jgi:hypothetical protein
LPIHAAPSPEQGGARDGDDTAEVQGLRLFGVLVAAFVALLAAIVVAGFLDQALGLWATVIWGLAVVGLVFLLAGRHLRSGPE